MEREELTFPSGDGRCAAWLYRPPGDGANGDVPCVVMAQGFSMTRHDGLGGYAEHLAAAGVAVLAFDYRHFGDSPGEPRQRFRAGLQREDVRSAIEFARSLPGVDGARIVLWGYSFGSVYTVQLAAREPDGIAAVIALAPMIDGLRRVLGTPPRAIAAMAPRALADAAGRHTTVPATAPVGGIAPMALPGEADGFARAVPEGSPWRNEVSPAILLTVAAMRPFRLGSRLRIPVWVGVGERDISAPRRAAERLAELAPRGELHLHPADHFDVFTGDRPARLAANQAAFLRRHGLTAS
jgi:pimeloyl-ACP methyl ester carboxylesterase